MIDHANQDYITGWAYHRNGVLSVDVYVDERRVGTAEYGGHRVDVRNAFPGISDTVGSGFGYLFNRDDLTGTGKAVVSVRVVCRSASGDTFGSAPIEIPTTRLPSRYARDEDHDGSSSGCIGPFPVAVQRILGRLQRDGQADDRPWTVDRIDRAVDDLIDISKVASKDTAGLFTYFSYLREMWTRLEFIAENFPAMNRMATEGRKDVYAVATSPIELYVICHHLATLRSHGVEGNLCEFGCFKGFSTAALSEACFRLGVTLDVFDSFAGLPDSGSTLYRPGEFEGSFDEVRANVAEFGNPQAVRFHKGFFSESVDLYEPSRIACIWMDVDLEVSARDAMKLLPRLDPRSCVFSDECAPEDFVAGLIVEEANPDRVIGPICDAFRADGRVVKGNFVAGCMGFFRDEKVGIPALMAEPLLRLRDALL